MKRDYHEAIMYLYLGNESQEREKWGEAVVYMQTAVSKLESASKTAKVFRLKMSSIGRFWLVSVEYEFVRFNFYFVQYDACIKK